MAASELVRVLDVLLALSLARSTSVIEVPGGRAVLNSHFPFAHDHNRVLVTADCDAVELAAATEQVMAGADLAHRRIDIADVDLGARLASTLVAHGYRTSRELLMRATTDPARPGSRGQVAVVELELDERATVASAEWRRDRPDWSEEVTDQLGGRIATVLSAADVTFLAVRDHHGEVIAHADLYVRDGVAQIEEVITDPSYRRRGLASRLVLEGVQRGRAAGADPVFLIADAGDWPQQLYRRLGFTDLATTMSFTA